MGSATLLADLQRRLAPLSETATLDAQVLLAHILGKSRAWVLAHPDAALDAQQTAHLAGALHRLEAGEPLPYVLGRWEFFGLEFDLTPDVLIPRPETELMVEQAIAWLDAHPDRRWAADVGTGSGCIAGALAVRVPDLKLVASDFSLPALRVAQGNLHNHGVSRRVYCVQADMLAPVSRPYDLICSNPPYIPSHKLASLPVARWEPSLALDGGQDGLQAIRHFLQIAPRHLAERGLILIEIESTTGAEARQAAQAAFPQAKIGLLTDLAGRERLLTIQT